MSSFIITSVLNKRRLHFLQFCGYTQKMKNALHSFQIGKKKINISHQCCHMYDPLQRQISFLTSIKCIQVADSQFFSNLHHQNLDRCVLQCYLLYRWISQRTPRVSCEYLWLECVHSLSSIGQIQTHDAVMRLQDRRVRCEVSGGSGVRLNVDAPLVWVQAEGGECPFLTQQLNLIDNLCTPIIPEKAFIEI